VKVVEMIRIVVDEADSDGVYLWTTGDEPVDHDGDTYLPYPVARGDIVQSGEINRANIRLSVPPDCELARDFNADPPDVVASVTVFRKQDDDAALVWWRGRVASLRSSGWETEIECESVFTGLRRIGVRARYQRQCRHALYGRGCNVDKSAYATATTCTAVDDKLVTVAAALTADAYLGGIAECNGVQRFIVGQSGGALTLWRPFPVIEVGSTVTVYPGCDRSLATCAARFNNAENHGGFPWLPTVNPFKFVSLW
jgi:uncharacterized phage protein (TIGR02218 family)